MGGGPTMRATSNSNLSRSQFSFNTAIEHPLNLTSTKVSRLVLGGVPTLDEAKEATSELKDALEMMYFPSTNAIGSIGLLKSSKVDKEPAPETKSHVTKEGIVTSFPWPKHACEALSLLNESHEAQSAVASIASDQNVWNAVMQNEKVMEFLKLRKSTCDMDIVIKEHLRNDKSHDEYKCLKNFVDDINAKDSEDSGEAILEFINKLKLTFTEMVKSVFGLLENIFAGLVSGRNLTDMKEKGSATNVDMIKGAAFMALGVLTIMMVVLKRGETTVAVQFINQLDTMNFLLKTAQSK